MVLLAVANMEKGYKWTHRQNEFYLDKEISFRFIKGCSTERTLILSIIKSATHKRMNTVWVPVCGVLI